MIRGERSADEERELQRIRDAIVPLLGSLDALERILDVEKRYESSRSIARVVAQVEEILELPSTSRRYEVDGASVRRRR